MNKDNVLYIIERILEYASETITESRKDKTDVFLQGKMLAYTEVLDVIQIELKVCGESLEEYGMDIDMINDNNYILEMNLTREMAYKENE